eukprot:Em0349g1a
MMCDSSYLRYWSTFPSPFQPPATSLSIQNISGTSTPPHLISCDPCRGNGRHVHFDHIPAAGRNKGIELVQSGAMRNWVSEHFKKIHEQQYVGNAQDQTTPGTKSSETQMTQVPPTSPKPHHTHAHRASISGADLTSVRADMKRIDMRLSKELDSLKDTVAKLTQKVEQVMQGVGPADASVKQQNIQFLRTMDTVN